MYSEKVSQMVSSKQQVETTNIVENRNSVHLQHSDQVSRSGTGSTVTSYSSSTGNYSAYETRSRVLMNSSNASSKASSKSITPISSVKNGNHISRVGNTLSNSNSSVSDSFYIKSHRDNSVSGSYLNSPRGNNVSDSYLKSSRENSVSDSHRRAHRESSVADSYLKANRDNSKTFNHSSIVATASGTNVRSSTASSFGLYSAVSHLRNVVLYVPRLAYWSLVHLFVLEKWFLHRSGSSNSILGMMKSILPLIMFLLLGVFVFNSQDLIASQVRGRLNKAPTHAAVPPKILEDKLPPLVTPPWRPELETPTPASTANYGELLEKISLLERSAEENRKSAEQASNRLNLLNKQWELKLQQEILNIKSSTTTVVEKLVHDLGYDKLMEKMSTTENKLDESLKTAKEDYKSQLTMLINDLEFKIHEEISKVEQARIERESKVIIASPAPTEPEPVDYDKLGKVLMSSILPVMMGKVKIQVDSILKECQDTGCMTSSDSKGLPSTLITADFDMSEIEKMILAAIAKYDADKTGLADLALESAGGTILSTRCTKSSQSKNSVLTLWGWKVWSFSNSPRSIIQPGVVPGECWVVEGATAEVVIQLISPAIITGVSLEHIPKAVSPYGKIDTAPKKFQVMGLMSENDLDSIWDYGTFEYLDNNQPLQYFPVQNKTETAYPIVELRVLSNHGSVKSTCIYRFRVHGEMIDPKN